MVAGSEQETNLGRRRPSLIVRAEGSAQCHRRLRTPCTPSRATKTELAGRSGRGSPRMSEATVHNALLQQPPGQVVVLSTELLRALMNKGYKHILSASALSVASTSRSGKFSLCR